MLAPWVLRFSHGCHRGRGSREAARSRTAAMADRPGQPRSTVTRAARVVVLVALMVGADAKRSSKKKKRVDDDHGCGFNLEPHKPKGVGKAFFVCDKTAPWLKVVSTSSGSEWTMATPTKVRP